MYLVFMLPAMTCKLKFFADYMPWNLIKPETNLVFFQYTEDIF